MFLYGFFKDCITIKNKLKGKNNAFSYLHVKNVKNKQTTTHDFIRFCCPQKNMFIKKYFPGK